MSSCPFVLIFLLFVYFSFGQTKPRFATENESKIAEINSDCVRHTTKSFTSRLKIYPFNSSSQIQLVSFKSSTDTIGDVLQYYKDSLPRKNDTVCYSKLHEIKSLTFTQVEKLTDVLYSYGYRKQMKDDGLIYVVTSFNCYNPRNAILFLDSSGEVFEFIEICFECEKTRKSSPKILLGEMCNQKMDLLKSFFQTVGIEYGINNPLITGD